MPRGSGAILLVRPPFLFITSWLHMWVIFTSRVSRGSQAIATPATAGFSGILAILALISSVTAIFCQKAADQHSQMRWVGRFPNTNTVEPKIKDLRNL